MQNELNKVRFSVKPLKVSNNKVIELARTVGIHPLAYQELPYDPEYSFYAGRLNPEVLSNASADEMYWKVRQEVIFRHTGEHPYEITGPDAEKLLQKIFTRDISKVKVGRCSYQFACYNDGGMITDGVLLRLEENKFWFAQADGDLFSWYKAHSDNLKVKISDPDVWVSQVQGPNSMKLLKKLTKETYPEKWKYFDWKEVKILNEIVIISRSGFSNELGWEIYFRKSNNTEKIGDYIFEEGKKMGMILTGTPGFRCKRIESGLLSAGQDFTHKTNPYDVGLGKYVDLKKSYFIGKSALETADKEKKCWGIRVENGTALKGSYVKLNNEIVGKVTSSTWSPFQKCGVGIVLFNSTKHKPGIIVDVDCNDGKIHKGEICTLPMYDFKNEIVRGLKTDIPKGPSPWSGIKKK
tara:strand:- start:119 stop:1345 length:1227 start_codon:yes stop_codon:yes gene_type:complete